VADHEGEHGDGPRPGGRRTGRRRSAECPCDTAAAVNPSLLDDEDSLRTVIGEVLREAGYTVKEARDGEEATAMAQSNERIDLLLVDIVLTGQSGQLVAEAVSRCHRDARIVYMSGYPDRVAGASEHFRDGSSFLQKPFTEDALLRRLRQALAPGPRRPWNTSGDETVGDLVQDPPIGGSQG
jgi:DNA-binding NtrC family response regulator